MGAIGLYENPASKSSQCSRGSDAEGQSWQATCKIGHMQAVNAQDGRSRVTWGLYRRRARARAVLDFEAAGAAPEEALRQAAQAAISLKAAPVRAPTLLPEDLHYEVRESSAVSGMCGLVFVV